MAEIPLVTGIAQTVTAEEVRSHTLPGGAYLLTNAETTSLLDGAATGGNVGHLTITISQSGNSGSHILLTRQNATTTAVWVQTWTASGDTTWNRIN